VITNLSIALLAGIAIVGIDRVSTIPAVDSIPVLQINVSRGRVVGPQDLSCGQKEIAQTSFRECPIDGVQTITNAQVFGLDMGMSDRVITDGRFRVQSHDPKWQNLSDIGNRQPNLKSSQIGLFQNDSFCADDNLFANAIDIDCQEFLRQ
tara:strand:+ start:447 stop:896 length:450 start_codon:yes stop_codon:yes gene_type:complete